MKFGWLLLLCACVVAVCVQVGDAKPQPQITGDDLSLEEEKRSEEPSPPASEEDIAGARSVNNNNDDDDEKQRPETPRGQIPEVVSTKRKDNIEDVILKELDDLKFSYTKGKKGGRGKDAKTEALNTDENQGVKESTKLDMPNLEEAKISSLIKGKDAIKALSSGISEDNDEDMKLHIPTLSSKLEGLLKNHDKSKFIETKKNGGKHQKSASGTKKKAKGGDGESEKVEEDAFNTHDNMETTVTPETVSNDVMVRRMKNIKTMKHGIPDLEKASNKKDKKRLATAAKQTKGKADLKLNNALLGEVSHDEKKTAAPVETSADSEGSGAKESVEIPEKIEGKHTKGKEEATAEAKSNSENKNVEGDKEDAEKSSEFAAEKLNEKEARGASKVTKGKEKVVNFDDDNNANANDNASNNNNDNNNSDNNNNNNIEAKEDETEKSEKVEKPVPENPIPKKKVTAMKKTKSNNSEALESGMESGSTGITNKSASDIKYNLNLENVKLKDVNLKIPDLENSKLGRMIGSKSVKVNVSVDVVKLEGMQIKVPESAASAAAPVKNQSLVFNELQEYKNNKKEAAAESVVDDVRQADFRAIEDVKNVGGNVAGASASKVSIPESEILKFADKNKDVSVKGITINNFKDLQAMPNKAAPKQSSQENKKKKDPKKLVEKLEKGKFSNDDKPDEAKQVESGSFGNKEKHIKIKSIKIKGLSNVKLDDLKTKVANKYTKNNVQNTKVAGAAKAEKELKVKGIRVKMTNGLHLRDMKLGDENVPVATSTKKEHSDKKKSAQQFNGMNAAGDENKEEDVKTSKSAEPSSEKTPSHEKPAGSGKAKPAKKVKTDDLHVATNPYDDDVRVKSSADNNNKNEKNENTEKLDDDVEAKAKPQHEEKHKSSSKKSNEKKEAKEAKEVAGHNSKEAQKPERVSGAKGIHLSEEKEGKKEDIHVEGVSRVKSVQDDIKLDEEKASDDNNSETKSEETTSSSSSSSEKKGESDASARNREEEYEKAFKLNLEKQGKDLNPDADEQNIDSILHFKSSDNNNDLNMKGFKLNNQADDDLLGEGSPLFHDNNISGVNRHQEEDGSSSDDTGLDATKKGEIVGVNDKRQSIPWALRSQKRLVINHYTLQIKDAPTQQTREPSDIDPKLDQPNHKLKKYGEKVKNANDESSPKVEVQSVRISQ